MDNRVAQHSAQLFPRICAVRHPKSLWHKARTCARNTPRPGARAVCYLGNTAARVCAFDEKKGIQRRWL